MKDYKMLFLDIDGTILRPDDTIEDSTKHAIAEMKDKGIEVVLATGRPLHEIMHTAEELEIDSFIAYNGAYANYKRTELVKEHLDKDNLNQFLEVATHHNHNIVFYTREKNYVTNLDEPKVKDFLQKFHLKKNELFTEDVINEILSLTLITNAADQIQYYPDIHNVQYSQVNVDGMRHSYDVIWKHVNKGVAVKMLLEHLEIPSEQTIAFGDGLNDKEMLSFVGEGFAMGNAHPNLVPYAKHVTTDVNNSGIYNGLRSLGLLT